MRSDPNSYPRQQFDQQQGYYAEQVQNQLNGMQQQQPVRGGAQLPAPPNSQGGTQEVQKSNSPDQTVIRSKQELGNFIIVQ